MHKLTLHLYSDQKTISPIEKFLMSCQPQQKVKILRQLQYVQEFGLTGSIPNNKKIAGTPLWEIRILGKDNLRILYTQTAENTITVLHIFQKKTQKIPQRELHIALLRYTKVIDR